MADPITLGSIIISVLTAIGLLLSRLRLRHCRSCWGCCDSDCMASTTVAVDTTLV